MSGRRANVICKLISSTITFEQICRHGWYCPGRRAIAMLHLARRHVPYYNNIELIDTEEEWRKREDLSRYFFSFSASVHNAFFYYFINCAGLLVENNNYLIEILAFVMWGHRYQLHDIARARIVRGEVPSRPIMWHFPQVSSGEYNFWSTKFTIS